MKSLNNLKNVERGRLLADLFPENLENICKAIQREIDYFLNNEEHITNCWSSILMTGAVWYSLVRNVDWRLKNNGKRVFKNPRCFSDQLFDGYEALLTIHCLIEYTYQTECPADLRHGIYMLFGEEKSLIITQKTNGHG